MGKGFFLGSELAKSKPPLPRLPQCGACGLYKGCQSPKMSTSGKGRKDILILGEAPGRDEDRKGIQFVGNTGRELSHRLKRFGINMRVDCVLDNAIICRPPNNATPTTDQINHCRPTLVKTLEDVQPRIIIPIGGSAVRSLLGHLWRDDVGAIGRWVGWKIPYQRINAWICPTYHPSYLLRSRGTNASLHFDRHIREAVKLKGRPWKKIPSFKDEVEIILKPKRAASVIRQMIRRGKDGRVAFDYETNTIKPETDGASIISCSVSWGGDKPERTIAYPWHGDAITATGELLRSKIPKMGHNIKFEDRWTRVEFGHPVRNWIHCSQIAAHVLDNRPGITSLDFQSFVLLGQEEYSSHIKPFLRAKKSVKVNRILTEVDLEDLLLYNGLDSLLTFHISTIQIDKIGGKQ